MNGSPPALTCPKCGGEMRAYERNGVHIDQCGECRGIFLDRGELERLIDAEGSYYEREPSRRPDEKRSGKPPKSKKRSFLENMLEGLGGE